MIGSKQPAKKRPPPTNGFKKGQSGNPSGRAPITPEERSLIDMCKSHTTEAVATILQIMADGDNDRNKLTAASYIIDRGWGKAPATLTVQRVSARELPDDELAAIIAGGGGEGTGARIFDDAT